jgi:serine phosphatase RsbU (regulator of sigma subunit)/CHASE2 domain-containing sensor protein
VALVVVLAALLLAGERGPLRGPRLAGFDAYQTLAPRPLQDAPVVIVEIDDGSLARVGQWPWPRAKLAQLVANIADGQPAAIGLDLVMPEPDRLSPDRLAELIPGLGDDLGRRLARLPDSDSVLGATLGRVPSVVGLVGLEQREPGSVVLLERAPVRIVGDSPEPFLPHFVAALRSVEPIVRGASGHGLINASRDGRVVRRIALAATVGDAVVPALGIEMLRVASGAPALVVRTGRRGVEAMAVGNLVIPTARDGSVRIHFALPDTRRFISAADVLAGRVDAWRFERRLVLVGVTAVGLGDRHATPVAPATVGVEIHAQLLESILGGDLLTRPPWARWVEAALLAVGGGLLVLAVPAWPTGRSALLALALVAVVFLLGFGIYRRYGILLDVANPALRIALSYGAMLAIALTEVQRQRRSLRRQLESERETTARMAGELEAARRIQMGILPAPADVLRGDHRISLHAFVEPARIVGGDLYDFFRLDADHLLFLVGDVSGHGVAGSLFMAVSKALCKSAALRRGGDLGATLRESNAEISRDNPEALFVTMWAGVLDARTGRLEYCNAGHEPAWVLGLDGSPTQPLTQGGGPPLCVIDDFPYGAASYRMRPGETLCLVTDGVTEATNGAGELYGRARLGVVLAGTPPAASVREVGEAIGADVARFAGGAEPSDDLTVLMVRWNGA